MNINSNQQEPFDEKQSLMLIKEMIEVSKNKVNRDGILFIVWGWLLFLIPAVSFVQQKIILTFTMQRVLNYVGIALFIGVLGFTVFYLIRKRNKVKTYIGNSLRYIWISLLVCMVFVNLIQMNVLGEINFELQHAIFMVLMAFAVIITGSLLRHWLIIAGGIIFGVLALASSFLELEYQLLLEAIAWIIAFIIPGHILYSRRNN